MKGFITKKRWQIVKTRGLSLLALLCFCAATLPLPLPTFEIISKDSSQPFPCQNSVCGCKTARQCWTNCCCRSPEQRFAWAEKNGITPPTYAVRHSEVLSIAVSSSDESKRSRNASAVSVSEIKSPAKSCCTPVKSTNSSTTPTNPSLAATCDFSSSKDSCCSEHQTDRAKANPEKGSSKNKITLSIMALKCQGKSSAFTLLPWTILISPLQFANYTSADGNLLVPQAENTVAIFYQPDTPPPKRLLS